MQPVLVITHSHIDTSVEEVLRGVRSDIELVKAMDNYSEMLVNRGENILDRWSNIVVTESGYYYAHYRIIK